MDPKWAKVWANTVRGAAAFWIVTCTIGYYMQPAWLFQGMVVMMVAVDLAAISGRWVNPGLTDFHPVTVEAPLVRELGILGLAAQAWWYLYCFLIRVLAAVTGFRRIWTHTPVVSSAIRALFGDIPIVALLYITELLFNFSIPREWLAPAIVGQIAGLSVTDIAYYLVNRGQNGSNGEAVPGRSGRGADSERSTGRAALRRSRRDPGDR